MALIDTILGLPIQTVVDKLGLEYKKLAGSEFSIIDGGDVTSGWKFNTEKNFVEDFSKDRAEGNPFAFVRSYLKLDTPETYRWFEQNFGVDTEQKTIEDYRRGYSDLSEKQIKYLKTRGIDSTLLPGVLKNVNGGIGVALYDGVTKIGVKIRRLTDDKTSRYVSVAGFSGDGIYMYAIDPSKNYIIVVEGMTDFLSLRQFDTNVIGLSSAVAGIQTVKKFAKDYDIYLVTDNDEAGRGVLQQMNGISYSWFDVSQIEKKAKDVNDIITSGVDGNELIPFIIENSEYQAPISAAFDRYFEYQKKIKKYGKLGIDGPFPEIDAITSGVIPGKVYAIGAYSNVGKSKLSYYYASYFLKAGKNVLFLNLEVDTEMFMANIISAMENVTPEQQIAGHSPTKKRYKNLITYDNIYKMSDIEQVVMDSGADIVFIDFVQNIEGKGGGEYEKIAAIARAIQRMAIQSHATVFTLSQISNDTAAAMKEGKDTLLKLKGGGELFASSDVVFFLSRSAEDGFLRYRVEKNKFGRAGVDFMLKVEYATNQFTIEDMATR